MSAKRKVVNLISLVLLILVFWNIFKPKKVGNPAKSMALTTFEEALDCKCARDFVVTPPLKVVKKMIDATSDPKDEKWMLQTSTGQIIVLDHDLNLCRPLNLQKNDTIIIAGEFIWTDKGAVIQNAHFDPLHKRSTGYIDAGGTRFCDQPM